MKFIKRIAVVVVLGAVLDPASLFACGDKVLVDSRGTRYQRPKNARTAAIVIYGNHPDAIRLEEMLKRQGHRTTMATTLEQLATLVSVNRFDVVLATSEMAVKIEQFLAGSAAASGVVVLNTAAGSSKLLRTIDKAVAQHDRNLRTNASH